MTPLSERHSIEFHPSVSLFTPPHLPSSSLIHPSGGSQPPPGFMSVSAVHLLMSVTKGRVEHEI